MPWVRIDEEFPDHPKVVGAGPLGIAMQVAALCYCNRHLTDGVVPRSAARRLIDLDDLGVSPDDVIKKLLAVGMWEEVENGYRIHDFHDYQPTREEVEAQRVAVHEAKVAGGKARAAGAKRDRGRFTKAQVGTSTTSSPPADEPADDQQPTSPVPVEELNLTGSPPSLSLVVSDPEGFREPTPKNRTEREGKAPRPSRPPRTPRHPSDEYVIGRARQIRAESGPDAARAYLAKVGENYGQASRDDQLRRLEAIIAQDAAAEAGDP